MNHNLIICEKPSVAISIAAVLGARERRGGYLFGNGYIITWCFGHLLELASPDAYDERYAKWRYEDLPIIPSVWKHTAAKDKAGQLKTLMDLMNREDVDCVINACDAGREGENIFRAVYDYAKSTKPMKRLWISSMEDSAIKDGFASLKDGTEYDNLYSAALCREQADWIVGLNCTRLFSVLYGSVLNTGRVQSPTLAMLVNRDKEISEFVKKPFYTVELDCGGFTAASERFDDAADAERIANGLSTVTISDINQTEKSIAPPKLYDLTTLQREANRIHGFTAQQTLDYVQSLYEKKLSTYPRTDSRYLTDDMASGVAALVEAFSPGAPCNVSQVINKDKVSDHHAILPTSGFTQTDLSALQHGERIILDMIISRLICAVGEKHSYLETIIMLNGNGADFKTKGKTVLNDGWKTSAKMMPEDDEDEVQSLPVVSNGQTLPVTASIKEGATSPPRRYTEDTLLSAMETAGADDMPDDAERKGLGTPATRAAIIEKLVKYGFAERIRKNLMPTEKGKNLIGVLPDALTSALLTAEWEQKLSDVQNGKMDGCEFINGIAEFTRSIISSHTAPKPEYAASFGNGGKPASEPLGVCPRKS